MSAAQPTAGDGADGKKPPATSPTGQSAEHQGDAALRAAQVEQVEQQIEHSIRHSPLWQAKREVLESLPAIGKVNSSTLLARLPELGQFTRQKICALVGVAPYDDDSGQWHGRRHIAGGRAGVRQVLYMATLSAVRCNPELRAYYQRLLGRGVEPKAALIAVLRKMLTILNAMVRDNTPWRPLCPTHA